MFLAVFAISAKNLHAGRDFPFAPVWESKTVRLSESRNTIITSMDRAKKMSEIVFWDTTAFVALSNANDDLHQKAVKVSRKMAKAKAHVLTTDAVLITIVCQ